MQALAEVKKKEQELKEKSDLVRVLTEDRDRALATVKQHGLKVDHHIDVNMPHLTAVYTLLKFIFFL